MASIEPKYQFILDHGTFNFFCEVDFIFQPNVPYLTNYEIFKGLCTKLYAGQFL
jgi:hypothetical protein